MDTVENCKFLPGDRARLPDGSEAIVNSSCYGDEKGRKFTVCGGNEYPGPMFYWHECELIERPARSWWQK